MRCASHANAEAIAICRACFKGVCPACAKPSGRAFACSAECAIEATRLQHLTAVAGRNTGGLQRTQAMLLLVLALGGGVAAIVATDFGRWILSIMAAFLAFMALRFFRLSAQWRESERG